MPRLLFRKITPRAETLRSHWALKPFGRFFGDPRLWSLQRRTVAPAFGAGLAICFIPLPIHIPVAALVAIFCRIHIPTIMLALVAVNPLTIVPAYLLAYSVFRAAYCRMAAHAMRGSQEHDPLIAAAQHYEIAARRWLGHFAAAETVRLAG